MNYLDRMRIEYGELSERHQKLGNFLETELFFLLADMERALILAQDAAMSAYATILLLRIRQAELEEARCS